jgi:hypothetical protein
MTNGSGGGYLLGAGGLGTSTGDATNIWRVSRTRMYHMRTALFSMYSSAFDFDGRR